MSLVVAWAIAVAISAAWHRTAWEPVSHSHSIECLACHNRKKMMRWATISIVGLLILWHGLTGNAHSPDFAFFALVIVSELT